MCVVLGPWMGLISHLVHFANQISHHASVFVQGGKNPIFENWKIRFKVLMRKPDFFD